MHSWTSPHQWTVLILMPCWFCHGFFHMPSLCVQLPVLLSWWLSDLQTTLCTLKWHLFLMHLRLLLRCCQHHLPTMFQLVCLMFCPQHQLYPVHSRTIRLPEHLCYYMPNWILWKQWSLSSLFNCGLRILPSRNLPVLPLRLRHLHLNCGSVQLHFYMPRWKLPGHNHQHLPLLLYQLLELHQCNLMHKLRKLHLPLSRLLHDRLPFRLHFGQWCLYSLLLRLYFLLSFEHLHHLQYWADS